MFETYDAKPWLHVGVGYVKGRLTRSSEDWPGRFVAADWLANDGGDAECLCCPEIGYKQFRRRHTLARFLREHRHCGKAVLRSHANRLRHNRGHRRGKQGQPRISDQRPSRAD